MKRYRGTGCVSRIAGRIDDPSTCIRVRLHPARVHYFMKIMEAYSHLVFISPIDSREGIMALLATPDNMPEVRKILENFPGDIEIMDSAANQK